MISSVDLHHNKTKLVVLLYQHLYPFTLIHCPEFYIEWNKSFFNRPPLSLNHYFSTYSLILDALDDQTALHMNEFVGTCYFVNLMKSSQPLCEITASFLKHFLLILIDLVLQLKWLLFATDNQWYLMAMNGLPLRHHNNEILSWFGVGYWEVYRLSVRVLSVNPSVTPIVFLIQQDGSIPYIAVENSAMMIKSFIFLTDHKTKVRNFFNHYLSDKDIGP